MKKLITSTFFLVLFAVVGYAQESALHSKVAKMIELSGAKANFSMVIDQMIDMQKAQFADQLPEEFFTEFKKEAKSTGFTEIVAKLVPVYMEHHTEAEIDGMIAFYESEIGKKMVEKTPQIMQQSMQIGQQWGMEMGAKIAQRLQEEAGKVKEKRN
ncbi:MAG: DUF2059 domain-containing protein [Saprospiraceae bacterium]